MTSETDRIRERYARRKECFASLYDPTGPAVSRIIEERQRTIAGIFRRAGLVPVRDKRVLEIGCGKGTNLLHLLIQGFRPENLVGNELIEERAREARHLLPAATEVITGDACELDLPDESFDIVLQSTVFTSILDDEFQKRLADRMWALVKPGGGVLWYDFVYSNPRNPDVRGVPLRRVRELFPDGKVKRWRVTLAPPIARRVVGIHPALYTLFNAMPFLRTHILCWIVK
ncbi:MAG: class I SAM-dependent methyltransferase [Planctomycetota bacterium]